MAIKVTLGATENTQQQKPFPKLMKTELGDIIFMATKKWGLPIVGENWDYDHPDFADFSNRLDLLEDYNEPITIQNL